MNPLMVCLAPSTPGASGVQFQAGDVLDDIVLEGTMNRQADVLRATVQNIVVRPRAQLLGPIGGLKIKTGSGNITMHDACLRGSMETETGRILVADGSRVEGHVSHVGPKPSAGAVVRVQDSVVTGEVTGYRIELENAKVGSVMLCGPRWNDETEGRIELKGEVQLPSIKTNDGRCVVVWHNALAHPLRVEGERVQELDLTVPLTTEALINSTKLPTPTGAFSWDDWHGTQHVLERLCTLPELSRFRDHLSPTEWLSCQAALEDKGRQVGALFDHWQAQHPAALLKGMKALSVPGLERSCAALGLAVLNRDPEWRSSDERALLNEMVNIARDHGANWAAIRGHLDQLEGRGSNGMPMVVRAGPTGGKPALAPSRELARELSRNFAEFRSALQALPVPATPGAVRP